MKIKKTTFVFSALLMVLSGIAFAYSSRTTNSQTDDWSNLKLRISTPKSEYLLGEVVQLNFEVINEGSKRVILPSCSTVKDGYLRVYIAYGNQTFKEHFGNNSRWQFDGGCNNAAPLEPGQSFKTDTTVLWNVKPEVQHLNKDAAKYTTESRIMNDYALPESGTYFIKAALRLPGETRPTIESAPIEIVVSKPVGEDLNAWDKIKNNKEFAYFIQYGEFLTRKPKEKEEYLKSLDKIIEKYPNSFYAERIRQNLDKFKAKQ